MNKFIQIVNFDNQVINKKRALGFISSLTIEKDCRIKITVSDYVPSKTLEQLGYFFSVIIPACKDWQGLTDLEADLFLKDNCCQPRFKSIMGTVYTIRPSIARMKVKEMAIYIDDCINFLGVHGISVPPPTYKG